MEDKNENIEFEQFKAELENVRRIFWEHRDSWQHTKVYDSPAQGQLHQLKDNQDMPEAFVLVTSVEGNTCTVIPGSRDAMKGGQEDVVLPRSVLGDYSTLSMDLRRSMPISALGKGFAKLDAELFQKVINTQMAMEDKAVDGMILPFALPYIGEGDFRIAYHDNLKQLITKACERKDLKALLHTPQTASIFILPWLLASQHKRIQRNRAPMYQNAYMAVAADEEKEMELCLVVPERDVRIYLTGSRTDHHVTLNVYDAAGNYSQQLDGCQIYAVSGELLATIEDGLANFDCPDAPVEAKFFILTPDGKELQVKPLED